MMVLEKRFLSDDRRYNLMNEYINKASVEQTEMMYSCLMMVIRRKEAKTIRPIIKILVKYYLNINKR